MSSSASSGSPYSSATTRSDVLPVHPESGLYMLPGEFGAQMAAARRGWSLAVGLRQSEYPLMLRICGYQILLATPIRSKESIVVRPVSGGDGAGSDG